MSNATAYESLEGIAIIGMSGQFPGAHNLEEFWQNLCEGVESITPLTDEEVAAANPPEMARLPTLVKAAPMLDDIEGFDASFFGYTPKEAEIMDPQQRLFLECSWAALEDAGYDPDTYKGWISVYAGVATNGYLLNNILPSQHHLDPVITLQLTTANDRDYVTTRVSYKLNLKGPSFNVQSACSTSLVAVHLACQSLLNYQCDMALAGGVSLRVPQKAGYLYQEGGMYSPDGHCRAFDADAKGTIFGSGLGAVVLKRLSDAMADGDTIYAVIKGSAVNNDGSLKVGFTAPGVDGQAAVVAMAQSTAGVDPDTISYVEAHGTGTNLGDPIEVAALTQVFRASTQRNQFCAIGSLKTNIGHMSAAAGVAGLIKTALALKHKQIPASLNFNRPNPKIDFENSPFYVNTELREWPAGPTPRRAGLSSFGVGGTNAHAILEEAPPVEPSGPSRRWQMLVLSARSIAALDNATANLAAHLRRHRELNLADVAYTLKVGRRPFGQRRMLVCSDLDDAINILEGNDPKRIFTREQAQKDRPVVFMFSGQGAQYVNMAADLYQTELTFRAEVDRCAKLLLPHLGQDLRSILYPSPEREEIATQQLKQTAITQPALFVIEYALAKLLMAWGIQPQALIGHSIGEYVAATLAGVLSLEDALALVAMRGRLMQSLPTGSMLSVPLPEQDVLALLGDKLSLAAVNAPARCVVSGPTEAVDALEEQLRAQGIDCRPLHTSHAFHSAMMEPILAQFTAVVGRIALHAPTIPYLSNVTGTWITADQTTDPSYWATHLRQAVRFADGIQELAKQPERILLEVGPGQMLSSLARQHPNKAASQVVLSSIRHPNDQQPDDAFLQSTLGQLWLAGATVDWSSFYANEWRHRVSLPSYPFEHQRYWIDPPKEEESAKPRKGSLRKKADIADWFYIPSWKRSLPPVAAPASNGAEPERWLVFGDGQGLSAEFVSRLRQSGQDAVMVLIGQQFDKLNDTTYSINPAAREEYDELLSSLNEAGRLPTTIAHLWNVASYNPALSREQILETAQDRGFYSLIYLAQALGNLSLQTPVHIGVVSNDMQRVASETIRHPEKAPLLGPCKVIPQEFPKLSCSSIDVQMPAPGSFEEAELVDQLIAEVAAKSSDVVIAYRSYDRWVQSYEATRVETAIDSRLRLREAGVYLITGGLGGIGLVLADYLAQNFRARLVLIGRSRFPDREEWSEYLATHDEQDATSSRIRKVQELEAHGAEVLVLSADVASEQQMRAAIDRTYAEFGALHGIIHAAGVAGGGVIQLKSKELAASVLSPKVNAMWALEAALGDRRLDFMMLCSSTIGVIGGFGQVDYCGANSFLDVFAPYYTSKSGTFTVSVNWDAWLEVGMAVNTALPQGLKDLRQTTQYQPFEHPLLEQWTRVSEGETRYVTELQVDKQWALDEHRIAGTPALPGTSYLEIARAAFSHHAQAGAVLIQDVFFMTPLMVGLTESKELHTILEGTGDELHFRVQSKTTQLGGAARWQDHVMGRVSRLSDTQPHQHDIEALIARCNVRERIVTEEELDQIEKFVYWGPRWRSLKKVHIGNNEGLGLLELPEAFADDLNSFGLHPALLDVATAFASGVAGEGSYLPLSYTRLKFRGALPQRIYSYVKYNEAADPNRETISFDITIMDEFGTELVDIEQFTMKRVNSSAARSLSDQEQTVVDSATPLDTSALAPVPMVTNDVMALNVMAASGEAADDALPTLEGMTPGEGVDAFTRILSRIRLPQIVVCIKDLDAAIERARSATQMRMLEQIEKSQAPRPTHARPNVQTPYVEPTSDVERALSEVWQRVLGIDAVGIHDNFFELGGDSVLAIQIIARANEAGFHLTPAQLFQHQTVAELAAQVGDVALVQTEPSTITGPVPLTPIQHWFFDRHLPNPNHWNQALLLTARQQLDPALLERALQQVLTHHDALRLRFTQDEHGWQQQNAAPEQVVPFTSVDFSTLPESEHRAEIEATAADLHASLNLTHGPLVRVAHFDLGPAQPSRVLLVIHHLLVDEASWRLILDDLQAAYEQLSRGEAVALPAKTASFKRWAERLQDLAQSDEVKDTLSYWLDQEWTDVAPLPIDHAADLAANTYGSARSVVVALSAEETQNLLHDVATAYRTQTDEVLLTAIAQAFQQWDGGRSLLVELQGRGRDAGLEDLDLSRTVGCLTTRYPMLLDLGDMWDIGDVIKGIKEQLRRVPQSGISYGLLRYLSADQETAERLAALPQPEIGFTYEGQIEQIAPDAPIFSGADALHVAAHSPQGRRSHLVDIAARIVDGQLQMEWRYSEQIHSRATIEDLAYRCTESLQTIIEHCLSGDVGGYTPSDFPEAGLSQKDLDKFMTSIRRRAK
ncbi:MAG TPA: condensation domain-containing protein [Herpetosiphonaceae bacterium]